MTEYNFWLTPLDGEIFRCVVAQPKGDQRACLHAAALVWEALLHFGNPMTRHPTTGETPEEFRARGEAGGQTAIV